MTRHDKVLTLIKQNLKEIKHRNYVILKQFPAEYLHI